MKRIVLIAVYLGLCRFASSQGVISFGEEIPKQVQIRIKFLLSSYNTTGLNLQLGSTGLAEELISQSPVNLTALGPEGFVVVNQLRGDSCIFAALGNTQIEKGAVNRGTVFAIYALMEELGFAFLHPLNVTLPPYHRFPAVGAACNSDGKIRVLTSSQPRWEHRNWHYHTMHPLDLTNAFNGWGVQSIEDEAGFQSLLPHVMAFGEWLVANRQNRLEWCLLNSTSTAWFARSPMRTRRLREVTTVLQQFGIMAGADVPLLLQQQHAMHIINKKSPIDWRTQVQVSIDWLVNECGFDFISSENGDTEFTHSSCTSMLEYINYTANYVVNTHGIKFYIKCHISTAQHCSDYKDPRTGLPLNFNFLPMLANTSVGVYAHTVQIYSFQDFAPTYGNTNFSYMYDFLTYEATHSTRDVVYHGETAYWINYDINVPLFLPSYALGRIKDLVSIAKFEDATGSRIAGQSNFCSGWEWSYWMWDVLVARASWDPSVAISATGEVELESLLRLRPFVNAFGESSVGSVSTVISDFATRQADLLINGTHAGTPADLASQLTGMGYLEGWDSLSDLADSLHLAALTQPGRVSLRTVDRHLEVYNKYVLPMLEQSVAIHRDFATNISRILFVASDLFDEVVQTATITYLRAKQVKDLYAYISGGRSDLSLLRSARGRIAIAQGYVEIREQRYRSPNITLVMGWGIPTPVSYHFGFLWTAHSLYFWWRDYGIASEAPNSISPCFMNILNNADAEFGQSKLTNLTVAVYDYLEKHYNRTDVIVDCLSYPEEEPVYPRDMK